MLNVKDIKKLHAIFENENVEEIEIRNGESSLRLTLGADAPKAQSRAPECAPVAAAAVSETPAPVSNESELHSKWIGFFTRLNPKNGENYIKLRDMVKKGEVVGHVRVLGVLQDIRSEVDGKVKEILIEEGQPIEYGQPVMRIEISNG